MFNQDRLGLIADLNYLRAPHQNDNYEAPVQESYLLVPVGRHACQRCQHVAPLMTVLGIPQLALCAICDPADAAIVIIESSFTDNDLPDERWLAN